MEEPMVEFVIAQLPTHADALRALNIGYMRWVLSEAQRLWHIAPEQSLGMPVEDYVEQMLPKVLVGSPPEGVFYLVWKDGAAVAMGGLRRLDAQVAEVKRLYVGPQTRGSGLGAQLFQRLIADAHRFGYASVRLDTAPFMQSAHRIYEAHGFVDIAPYEGVEVPVEFHDRWRFMEKHLRNERP
ncbi:GNAT family N-acetyltransferase [Curvibacter sp. APW13]|uniref:GNAT family N-acetyltransferase n=1 Tax=Curvibacter sp. APW13 TaxID=3077236 RepID=UPI0028DE1FE0|nr:GNAT family N-acetyltransferase [Curvibacter sp. APW13]MDT8989969.1 GNAT family N-acetyltransferase [Curvibacter sp. APW13]